MVYYPDQTSVQGWAGPALKALGYHKHPERVERLIRVVFNRAISTIQIPGSQVIPVPLFHVLDGKNPDDYVASVEPSAIGGSKMAEFLLDIIERGQTPQTTAPDAPTSALMEGRG